MSDPPSIWRALKWFAIWLAFIAVLILAFHLAHAEARDLDGRYANSPNKEWFESQRNSVGQWCCNESDGHAYNGDYTINPDGSITIGDHRIEPYKVLKGANPTGHAVWWYVEGPSGKTTFCFAPGSLT